MKASIEVFRSGYEKIRSALSWSVIVKSSMASTPGSMGTSWVDCRLSVGQINYSGAMISIYGLFEEYVESSIEEYIEFLNYTCSKKSDFPTAIQAKCEELSLKLLGARLLPKYESRLSLPMIYSNLKSFHDGTDGAKANKEAFSYHTANLKKQTVLDLFSNLGVPSIFDEVKKEHFFQNEINNLSISEHDIYSWLDENSERRNIIAHSFSGIDDTLDESVLQLRLDALKALCEGISLVLINRCIRKILNKNDMQIQTVHSVFNNEILCFELSNPTIQVGDYLLSENGAGDVRCSEIVEIRIYDTPVNRVVKACSEERLDIAIRCGHKFKSTNNFYLVSSTLLSGLSKKTEPDQSN